MKKITFFSLLLLSTIFLFQNCAGGLPDVTQAASKSSAPPGSCAFTDQYVLDGQSVEAYSMIMGATAADCTAARQTRVCTQGNLSGSYPYSYCSVGTVTTSPPINGTPAPSTINLTLATNASNYNIAAAAGNPSAAVIVVLTINSGVIVGATSTTSAALVTGSFAAGSVLQIINNGSIYGAGGAGGVGGAAGGSGSAGSPGGLALLLNFPVTVTNNGVIGGGGGGGGGGNGQGCIGRGGGGAGCDGGGGGGGGAGFSGGVGGIGGLGTSAPGGTGGTGAATPGAGGTSTYSGAGGAGGTIGQPGNAGVTGTIYSGGVGGAPGAAVITNGKAIHFTGGGSAPNLLGVIQ